MSKNPRDFVQLDQLLTKEGLLRFCGLDHRSQTKLDINTDFLATIGSNMILEDKKLRLDTQKPYCYLTEILKVEPSASVEFEPKKRVANTAYLESLWAQNPAVQAWRESNPR